MGRRGGPNDRIAACRLPVIVVAATAALLGSARRARRPTPSRWEARLFRRINGAPDDLHRPVWVVMQSGSLAAVPIAAAATCRRRGRRTAVAVLVAGTAIWSGVKLVKPLVGRGRPDEVLGDVRVRGTPQQGLGYPSGHAAVATTLVVATARRPAAWAGGALLATAVGTGRIYVGAHLPLDVVGGLASGVIAGTVARSVAWSDG